MWTNFNFILNFNISIPCGYFNAKKLTTTKTKTRKKIPDIYDSNNSPISGSKPQNEESHLETKTPQNKQATPAVLLLKQPWTSDTWSKKRLRHLIPIGKNGKKKNLKVKKERKKKTLSIRVYPPAPQNYHKHRHFLAPYFCSRLNHGIRHEKKKRPWKKLDLVDLVELKTSNGCCCLSLFSRKVSPGIFCGHVNSSVCMGGGGGGGTKAHHNIYHR